MRRAGRGRDMGGAPGGPGAGHGWCAGQRADRERASCRAGQRADRERASCRAEQRAERGWCPAVRWPRWWGREGGLDDVAQQGVVQGAAGAPQPGVAGVAGGRGAVGDARREGLPSTRGEPALAGGGRVRA
ncbi:hypothetical protein DEJ48_00640 [Streptomyces venezuelae]|uniref:Uncharacterized protein n=1 Tax=Streptomyces venezuelae TaxID=54571 RepID=A0A5P2BNS8_STRVZ|nr:hypothetical protein DEJ48_00640 [Streptomyces venezuelae]